MKSIHMVVVVLVAIVCALPLRAEEHDVRTVEVTGTGLVTQSPDQARVFFAVETQAKTAQEANRTNAEQTKKLIAALKRSKIDESDLQTSNYSVNPRFRDRSRGDKDLKPIGFVVNNTVRATVRDLGALGQLMDKAVSAGATRVNRISFELSDPAQARNRALKLAMDQARLEAETLVNATPHKLGKVMKVRSHGGHFAPKMERAMMSSARPDTPIAVETLGTRAEVTVVFEILD